MKRMADRKITIKLFLDNEPREREDLAKLVLTTYIQLS